MKKHDYNFNGGEKLKGIGAAWFVSYGWYIKINDKHINWKNVSTYNNRVSKYNSTQSYHKYWLQQIVSMDEKRLETNKIGLTGRDVIVMAKKLLENYC